MGQPGAQHRHGPHLFRPPHLLLVARELLPKITALDWEAPAQAKPSRRGLIVLLRALLFGTLVAGRFGRTTLAWGGWALAIALWLRGRRVNR